MKGTPNMVTKRDGSVVSFNVNNIIKAILKAGEETSEFGITEATQMAHLVGHSIDKEKYISRENSG